MANHYLTRVLRMKMHCSAQAIFEHLAISARALPHPGAVAEGLETVFPDIEEIVPIDVALHIAAINVGTG